MTIRLVPPTPDEALGQARDTLEECNGEFMATIMLGTEPPTIMVTPDHPNLMFAAIRQMVKDGQVQRPDWITLISDTYYFIGKDGEPHPGRLAPLFAAGDPRVTEALVVTCAAPDGPSYLKCQPYKRLSDGSFEWGEIVNMEGSIGDIPRQMHEVMLP